MSFQNIFANGVLVDVDVHMWTGQRQLTPEDLGIKSEKLSKAFKLGKKALVPPEVIAKFRNIDYRARDLLIRNSFSFEFGSARFVPKKMFVDFSEKMDELKKEFNDLVNDFVEKYESYRLQMRAHYTQAAHNAYERLSQLHGFDKTRDEFINTFLDRVNSFYPDIESIRNKFSLEYVAFQMALPDLSQATIDDVAEEGAKVRMIEEAYQKMLTDRVHVYVDKLVAELRGKANTVLTTVASNLKAGKRFSKATMSMMKNMILEYRKMDIVGDSNFQHKLEEFEREFILPYDANKVRADKLLQERMHTALKSLINLGNDKEVIKQLAENYRNKVQL